MKFSPTLKCRRILSIFSRPCIVLLFQLIPNLCGIYSSVCWTQSINNIVEQGITNFIEIGPGKVLAGLNKKINAELTTLNVYDVESLNSVVEELSKEKELV